MDLGLMCANIAKLWTNYWHIYLIEGVLTTLKLTVFAVVLGALLGVVVAMLKMSKSKIIRFLITAYIEIIRGTPLLLQLMLFYFVLPELIPIFDFSEFTWVAIALCINSSAYVSEIFRSGIQSVDKGQTEAARSLGLSSRQTMLRIVMPQAIKNILPALGNEFIVLIKETSVAGFITVFDLTRAARALVADYHDTFVPYLVLAAVYLVIVLIATYLLNILEKRLRKSEH